jgi:hypothetical protein
MTVKSVFVNRFTSSPPVSFKEKPGRSDYLNCGRRDVLIRRFLTTA